MRGSRPGTLGGGGTVSTYSNNNSTHCMTHKLQNYSYLLQLIFCSVLLNNSIYTLTLLSDTRIVLPQTVHVSPVSGASDTRIVVATNSTRVLLK